MFCGFIIFLIGAWFTSFLVAAACAASAASGIIEAQRNVAAVVTVSYKHLQSLTVNKNQELDTGVEPAATDLQNQLPTN